MPVRPDDITLQVTDWPYRGKATSLSFDQRIMPDANAVQAYCERRFGAGKLEPAIDHTFRYTRRRAAVPLLWRLLGGLLNKSY